MMIGSLVKWLRVIHSRSGHNVDNLVIMGATDIVGEFSANPISIQTVLQERKRGTKGMNVSVMRLHSKVFSLGRKGSLAVRSCNGDRMPGVKGSLMVSTVSVRILRVCFWNSVHSAFVGILLKDF